MNNASTTAFTMPNRAASAKSAKRDSVPNAEVFDALESDTLRMTALKNRRKDIRLVVGSILVVALSYASTFVIY